MKRIVSQDGRVKKRGSRKTSPAERYRRALLEAVGAASLDFSGYCRLAAQAMLQSAMEIEVEQFFGRASYQRREQEQSAYRNGYKRRRVATGEGAVELYVPQTRDGGQPFQTAILDAYRRRSQTLEAMVPALFVKGLSVRDVSDTFQQVFEDGGISPATASPVSQQIYEDFDAWRRRSLSGVDLLYLFVDGMHLKLDPRREQKQPVLVAYGILWDERKVLLHVDVGDRESYEACLGFLRDMTERGLRPPLLYCSDDCPGLRKALKAVWPRSLPQKCQAHKMRNHSEQAAAWRAGRAQEADPPCVSVRDVRAGSGPRPQADRRLSRPLPQRDGLPGQESGGVPHVPEAARIAPAAGADEQHAGAADRGGPAADEGDRPDGFRTVGPVADSRRAGGCVATLAWDPDHASRSGKTPHAAKPGCPPGRDRVESMHRSHTNAEFTDNLRRHLHRPSTTPLSDRFQQGLGRPCWGA